MLIKKTTPTRHPEQRSSESLKRRDEIVVEGSIKKLFNKHILRLRPLASPQDAWCKVPILSILFILSINTYAQLPNLITEITAYKNKLKIVPAKEFADLFLAEPYFFAEYDEDVDITTIDDSILIIPFIAVTAPFIWATNSTYRIESIDEDYYVALQRIKTAYQILYPSLSWSGEIMPDRIVKNDCTKVSFDTPGFAGHSGCTDVFAASPPI